MPVARTASSGSPAPAADPIAAVTQIAAAVVRPRTESRRTKISPAPRNPTPVTIWAATREGSSTPSRGWSTSEHQGQAELTRLQPPLTVKLAGRGGRGGQRAHGNHPARLA